MGSNPGRKLSQLGFAYPIEGSHFRYRERSGRRHSLEAVLEESRLVALMLLSNMYYNVVILIYVELRVM